MEANIEISVIYSEKEIKKAVSFYILRVSDIRNYALIVYPILIIAIVLSLVFRDFAMLSFIYFFIGVILYYFYYNRPIQAYLKIYMKRKRRQYCFDKDRVLVTGEEFKSECLWSMFRKAYEIPSAFLLLDDNKSIYIFPKTCFSNTQILEQMRSLLAIKFPDIKSYK